ncbi:PTPRT-like protein [Mya arenaria]|uniref:PTPRT-like protein n=1 Tax=Mya arenaria TaxID=6604 RepID=A0ABY7F2Y1_MYAAR|nr:PTPRT-like protein [Mya arenaria]
MSKHGVRIVCHALAANKERNAPTKTNSGYTTIAWEDVRITSCVLSVRNPVLTNVVRDAICDICHAGYYGEQCQNPCPRTCTTCSSSTLCTSCKNGYHSGPGTSCLYLCNKECLSCTNNTFCTACKVRDNGIAYYGSDCSIICSNSCKDNLCDIDGHCLECAYPNLLGDSCDKCINGKYGNLCNNNCPQNCYSGCLSTGICESCKDGFFGHHCNMSCSENCKYGTCSQGGSCFEGCKNGFSGSSCEQKTCHVDCICDQNNRCLECKDPYFGPSCSHTCRYCKDRQCPEHRLTAEKCDACEEGTYGYLCNETCRQHCLDNRCKQDDGSCPCKKEYKFEGGKCVPSNCPANCSTCTSLDSCGTCVDKYYYGETCEYKCSNCKAVTHCDKKDGYCLHACADGLSGVYCDNLCYEGCETCHRFNASTCKSCKSGRYGNNGRYYTCNRMCNDNCMNNSCDYWNGQCDRGCVNGYRGDYCNATCPVHCLKGTCEQNSGTCERGCKNGYYGLKCVNHCISVDSNCLVCTSSQDTFSSCARCTNGSYPGTSGKCVPCKPNCSGGCNSSTGVCYACVDGYGGSLCSVPCASYCNSCLDDNGECNECEEGFWGNLCLNNCRTNCKQGNDSMSRCDIAYRKCKHGCVSGTFGSYCDRFCDKHCLASEGGALECIQKDGQCTLGCENGYIQTDAGCIDASVTIPINKDDSTSVGTSWAVIGAACGVVAILSLVLVIALVIRRKDCYDGPNKDEYEADTAFRCQYIWTSITCMHTTLLRLYMKPISFIKAHQDNMVIPRTSTGQSKPQQLRKSAIKSEHVAMDVLIKTSANNALQKVAQDRDTGDVNYCVNKVTVKDLGALKLPEGMLKTYQDAMRPENRFRNRYQDIYPYDDTRVKLTAGDTDFINASFVDGYRQENAYIASQGPTHKTMQDYSVFWRMVWQNKVGNIIMLTNLVEEMKPKCDQYWPGHELTNHYSEINVTCLTEDMYADFVTRTFSVKMDKEVRTVHHLHFTSWPDKGVPDDVTSLVDFRHRVLQTKSSLGGPTIVHCRTGGGRCGLFATVWTLLEKTDIEHEVSVFNTVRQLRTRQPNAVRTREQYAFCHECVIEYLQSFDSHSNFS